MAICIFGGEILWIESEKIFCEAHNFVPWWNFDKRYVACKAWDAGDADCGIARVNRATRALLAHTYSANLFRITFSTCVPRAPLGTDVRKTRRIWIYGLLYCRPGLRARTKFI